MFRRIPDRNIWIIYAAILLLGIAYGISIAVLAIHLKNHGIPKLAMAGLATAFSFGIFTVAMPAGKLVGRFGAKRTMLVALLGYACCVALFPFLTTKSALAVARFFDGAFSVLIWVAAETALLGRSGKTNKALVMSLYAMSLGIGYVLGPILATGVVPLAGTGATFVVGGVLAFLAAMLVASQFNEGAVVAEEHVADGERPLPFLGILRLTKTSCLGTFSYGYFQASVVIFLPLYLIEAKGILESRTILITAFFAAGMLASTTFVSRLGDRHGHLLVMRILGAIGGTMIASFVLLPTFGTMCAAVFVAGATIASISPVSLALQGVILERRDLGRANAIYNGAYALGMLLGPPISGLLFTRVGGGTMLLHLAAMWVVFVVFSTIFANDDPRRSRLLAPVEMSIE